MKALLITDYEANGVRSFSFAPLKAGTPACEIKLKLFKKQAGIFFIFISI